MYLYFQADPAKGPPIIAERSVPPAKRRFSGYMNFVIDELRYAFVGLRMRALGCLLSSPSFEAEMYQNHLEI